MISLSELFILCTFSDIMDLTCPSFVQDETSDYGSRDTSDSEHVISGLSVIEAPSGKIFSVHVQKKKKLHRLTLECKILLYNWNISELTIIFRGTQLFSYGKDFESKFLSS